MIASAQPKGAESWELGGRVARILSVEDSRESGIRDNTRQAITWNLKVRAGN